ncbi:hypothetical protein Lal_00004673 [Lupinus albus]|uniref:Uncharacterized protein n=1 Tax=Lupinus albus TaxID=3870 RepID=A0A6A4NHC8_LUPAL|nr:hypothetical protein Lalb_Chr23g0267571 [Lupinus albus]KAF1865299.1 hypothetical protein Lal_00004673 [Lupinus albus]
MRRKGQSQNMFLRIITIPLRVLSKARDIYVKSITTCGNNMNYNNPVDAVGRFSALPRSYSAATSTRSMDNEDFAELIRAASARTLVNRIDVDNLVLKQKHEQNMAREVVGANGLPKSTSVSMARIDEDMACDLGKECGVVGPVSYPRSRSYAV